MNPFYLCLMTLAIAGPCLGQAPVITGDSLICPNGTGIVSTGDYPAYQWYRRYFGSGTTTAIPGETGQTLVMDYFSYSASYVSVRVVTEGGDTLTSDEFFVDGWVFINPTVMTSGSFTIGPNGETILCPGDTAYFTLLNPYTVNITWYRNGVPLAGENQQQLVVTMPGDYYVTGAPAVCPEFIQGPGVILVVEECTTSTGDRAAVEAYRLWPNPASDFIHIRLLSADPKEYDMIIVDLSGHVVDVRKITGGEARIDVSQYARGVYKFVIEADGRRTMNGSFAVE